MKKSMYCKKCGSEISENDNLCPNCVTDQHESAPKASLSECLLKIFAFIFAICFYIGSFYDIVFAFLNLNFGAFYLIFFYLINVFVGIWMARVLRLIAFRRNTENTPALTFGIIVFGAARVVLRILSVLPIMFGINVFYESFYAFSDFAIIILFYISSISIISVIICIIVVYVLLIMTMEAPELKTLFQNPTKKLSVIFDLARTKFNKNS